MSAAIREWILGIVGAALLTTVSMTLTPSGQVKKVVSLVCGMVMVIMLIKPVTGFDYTFFSKNYAQLRSNAREFSGSMIDVNEKLTGLIIEEECSAYILDKGAKLGIRNLEVKVSAKWSEDGYWYPCAAKITTDAEKDLRDKLSFIIRSELGIPPEELIWSMNDEE